MRKLESTDRRRAEMPWEVKNNKGKWPVGNQHPYDSLNYSDPTPSLKVGYHKHGEAKTEWSEQPPPHRRFTSILIGGGTHTLIFPGKGEETLVILRNPGDQVTWSGVPHKWSIDGEEGSEIVVVHMFWDPPKK